MARRIHTVLIDDTDGSDAATTIRLGLDGVDYEIDLSDTNAAALRAAIEPWTARGRRTAGRRRRTPGAGPASKDHAIREWAREQGYDIGRRGRIAADIRDAYTRHLEAK